jgi:SAM-dependent methyltransferase
VDFSAVALDKARAAAGDRPGVTFVRADLFALPDSVTARRYDLIFDGGTLDDFPAARRRELAETLTRLARPGALLVLWCFSADRPDVRLLPDAASLGVGPRTAVTTSQGRWRARRASDAQQPHNDRQIDWARWP